MALGEGFLYGLYVFDSRPRLSKNPPRLRSNQPEKTENGTDNAHLEPDIASIFSRPNGISAIAMRPSYFRSHPN